MSDAPAAATPAKKGGNKKLILIAVGGLVLAGGGVGAGLYAAGMGLAGKHDAEPKEDPNKPKLVLREGAEEQGDHSASAKEDEEHPDPSRYKASYYPLEQNFTSNLRDSDGFAQVGVGVSTFYDAKVLDAVKDNEMPVRSAILMTLADQDSFVISTREGKKQLQKQLKTAINAVLKEKTGFGGIDDVYFTSFIIQ